MRDYPYEVTYYYLATGMEGRADQENWGVYRGFSPKDAIENALKDRYPEGRESLIAFVRSCLSARRIYEGED